MPTEIALPMPPGDATAVADLVRDVTAAASVLAAIDERLVGAAGEADEIAVRLNVTPRVGSDLAAGVESFLESHRAAGRALAGELSWLGDTVAAVADSWLRLDGSLVAPHGRASAE